MADHTAQVVKLTLTLTLMGHNLAKTGAFPLNRHIMRQNKAYRAIFCTLKTTSGFNSDHTIRQYAHGLLLESPFVIVGFLWGISGICPSGRPSYPV